ncbi:hypothetical protein Q9K02_00720 [Qipengyuania sp. G39]|uniref:Biopolymer transporter ExbD n=1 Tax=Qipengyuania profundimaris TaxID=3067652 RepID=A0ABT9HKI0_9SPHN|nr:biopolymer transporter ExbD [Qipengyuania sp. G39]MDP4573659.1 hypothetical protein [Qipengyuania sp. G39]
MNGIALSVPTDRCRRPRRRYCHGEPIGRPDSLPILLFVFALIAALLAMSPRATHFLKVDLPAPYPPGYLEVLTPSYDRIVIAANGNARWNSVPVNDAQLRFILDQSAMRPLQHSLLLTPDAQTPYPRVLEILRLVAAAGLNDRCFRFSGNARFARYDRPETFDNLVSPETVECLPYG